MTKCSILFLGIPPIAISSSIAKAQHYDCEMPALNRLMTKMACVIQKEHMPGLTIGLCRSGICNSYFHANTINLRKQSKISNV